MPYPLGVHEALQAWQDGEITYRRCLRLLGVDTIADLYAACRSSGVKVRIEPTEEEIRLSNRPSKQSIYSCGNDRAAMTEIRP